MNFSSVRGYNAYAQFSIKIREAVKNRVESENEVSKEPKISQEKSNSLFSEPVDTVTISTLARNASSALVAQRNRSQQESAQRESTAQLSQHKNSQREKSAQISQRENSPHIEFRNWQKSVSMTNGNFSQKIPGSLMNEVLSGSNITVGDDEEYDVSVDVWSSAIVSGKNAEKARAIQDLLNSTPIGINWGLLLAKLPPS